MWVLDKLSMPDWTKTFSTKLLAEQALLNELCPDCRKEPVPLRTSCGREYEIYEESAGPSRMFVEVSSGKIDKPYR